MKKLLCLIILFSISSVHAKNLTYSWAGGAGKTQIGFSLHNKSPHVIFVTIENESLVTEKGLGGFLQKKFGGPDLRRVLKGAFLDLSLDISKPTKLTLYDCNSLDECDISSARVIKRVKFTPNKTIYINWNGSKLYKQRGPLKGLTNATDKGYDLSGGLNVEDNDIKPAQK